MKNSIIKSTVLLLTFVSMSTWSLAQTKLDRSIKPKAGPEPKVQMGKIESFQLPNGLKVFVVENHKLPKVSFSIRFNIDPFMQGDKKGYTDLMAELLSTATTTRTKNQINSELDFIGGTLAASSEGVYASALKKHMPKLLDLMSDVILNPVFTEEELNKIKTQTLSGLASSKNTPENMAANIQAIMNYGKHHPYGEITTEQTVGKITLEDCKKYFETYFRPNVAYLAIVGDINLAEAKAATEKYFGKWQKAEVPRHTVPAISYPQSTKVIFVPRPNSVQSSVRVTYPIDLKPGSPDELKVKVLSDILGGGASARLFRNLRETYNLTYGAYSSMRPDLHIGEFEAYAEVRTIGTDSAVNEFMKEIVTIRNEKVSQEELTNVIRNMTGKFAISLEDPSTVARFAMNIDRYNLPADYYETYLTRLAAITVDDIYAVAQKYIRPDNAWIVVVGDRDKIPFFTEKWKKLNALKFVDQYGNDFIEVREAPKDLTAQKVIDNYITALGGAANIKKTKTMVMKLSASMGGYQIEITNKKMYPKKSGYVKSYESVLINGTMLAQKKVFDGTNGHTSSMVGASDITGDELEQLKLENTPFTELRYAELGYKLELIGIDVVNGKDVYKIEVTDPKGNKESHYYDVTTWLLLKKEGIQKSPEGETNVVSYFDDYKDVSGVKYPHHIINEAGEQTFDLKVTSLLINGKIDAKDFVIQK